MHFFEKGDKLIQLLIVPIETPELELVENVADLYGGETERGDNGFGSSGR
jgi:dUTP pyrophosphatase